MFEVEFTATNSKYTRHSLAVVGVANGEWRRQDAAGGALWCSAVRCAAVHDFSIY
jgi:hypothetical protein